MFFSKNNKGFTLIELLITVTIVGIVMVLLIVVLDPAARFTESRDAKRAADVTAIAQAIGIYRVDNGGQLPAGMSRTLKMIGTADNDCSVTCTIPATGEVLPNDDIFEGSLVYWLDAGTIDGLADGEPVVAWTDRSARGNDASQANVNLQPTYQSQGIGGQPVVRFDGSDALDSTQFSGLENANGATVFMVLSTTEALRNRVALSAVAEGRPSFPRVQKYPIGGVQRWFTGVYNNTWRYSTASVVLPNEPYLYSSVFDGNQFSPDDRLSLWVNTQSHPLRRGAGDPDITTRNVDRMVVGRWTNGRYPWPGDIAEIIVYNTALTQNQRHIVEAYLNNKYSLELGIGGEEVETQEACIDLQATLANKLPSFPFDPLTGNSARTRYAAKTTATGLVLVAACDAEETVPISAER